MNYTLEQLRDAHVEAALAEWRRTVRDDDKGKVGDRDIITEYYDTVGWSFRLARFGGTYREHATTSWCGHFVGATGLRIGDHLEPGDQCVGVMLDADVALYCTPSTDRLASPGKWRAAGKPMPVTYRGNEGAFTSLASGLIASPEKVLLRGTIATVETSGNKPENGDHVVLIESYDADRRIIHTVEGNGRGKLGDGKHGEGVVRCERPIADVRRVYHLDLSHYESMERP